MRARKDQFGRLVGTSLKQDVGSLTLAPLLIVIVLISLLLYPPAKRVGSKNSWT